MITTTLRKFVCVCLFEKTYNYEFFAHFLTLTRQRPAKSDCIFCTHSGSNRPKKRFPFSPLTYLKQATLEMIKRPSWRNLFFLTHPEKPLVPISAISVWDSLHAHTHVTHSLTCALRMKTGSSNIIIKTTWKENGKIYYIQRQGWCTNSTCKVVTALFHSLASPHRSALKFS